MTREEAINKLQYIRTHYPSKNIENIEADNALVMAIDALNFIDIDLYCKEHFCVMVDRDVWEKAEKALEKEPKTGHLIMDRQRETRQCDKCMTVYRWSFYPHNYCPSCGAEMKEGDA